MKDITYTAVVNQKHDTFDIGRLYRFTPAQNRDNIKHELYNALQSLADEKEQGNNHITNASFNNLLSLIINNHIHFVTDNVTDIDALNNLRVEPTKNAIDFTEEIVWSFYKNSVRAERGVKRLPTWVEDSIYPKVTVSYDENDNLLVAYYDENPMTNEVLVKLCRAFIPVTQGFLYV